MPRKPCSGYVERDEIRRLRVKVWFHAVQQKSGLSIQELEEKFSSRMSNEGWKSGIWSRYKNGNVTPRTRKGAKGQDGLAQRVEVVYPGTQVWLEHRIWRVLDQAPMDLSEIRKRFDELEPPLHEIFVENPIAGGRFWRTTVWLANGMPLITDRRPLDKLYVLLLLLKEAETCQDRTRFAKAVGFLSGAGNWVAQVEELARFRPEFIKQFNVLSALN